MKDLNRPPIVKGLDFSEKEIKEAQKNKRLCSISLFTSNVCNLKCLYCYRDAGSKDENETTFEVRVNILMQAKELGARTVIIPGAGEPFCDPFFYNPGKNNFPLIEIANQLDMHVVVFTNGTLITEKNAAALAVKNVSVVTKLNSFKKGIQDKLSGKADSHKQMLQGIDLLLKAGFQNDWRLGIDSVIVRQNYSEILALFRFCRANHVVPYITTQLHGGRGLVNAETLDVSNVELKTLFHELLDCDQNLYGYTWTPAPPIVAGNCKKLFYDIVVDHLGNIQICPGINISLGNIKNTPLKKALDSGLIEKVRNPKKYLKGKCNTCKNEDCSYGCRLSAYAMGDLFGEDPQCWKGENHGTSSINP